MTSFNLMYRIPAFLIVGWAAAAALPTMHLSIVMGVKTPQFFDMLDMPYEILEADNLEHTLDQLLSVINQRSVPGALLVRAGVIS